RRAGGRAPPPPPATIPGGCAGAKRARRAGQGVGSPSIPATHRTRGRACRPPCSYRRGAYAPAGRRRSPLPDRRPAELLRGYAVLLYARFLASSGRRNFSGCSRVAAIDSGLARVETIPVGQGNPTAGQGENDMASYKVRINGFARSVESSDPDNPLLYALRGLGLTATKFGCGLGQCGACTVLIDGQSARSCPTTIADVQGNTITASEGLGSASAADPIQAAFIQEQVPQCGYCTSGLIMSAAALLAEKPKPTEDEIRTALDGNLCRCGTHVRVIRAVLVASG